MWPAKEGRDGGYKGIPSATSHDRVSTTHFRPDFRELPCPREADRMVAPDGVRDAFIEETFDPFEKRTEMGRMRSLLTRVSAIEASLDGCTFCSTLLALLACSRCL